MKKYLLLISLTLAVTLTTTTAHAQPSTVTGIAPIEGLVTGNNAVTISGTYFLSPTPYIEFTGHEYINTGISQTGNIKVEVDFQATYVDRFWRQALFGARNGSNGEAFAFFLSTATPAANPIAYSRTDYGSDMKLLSSLSDLNRHFLKKDKKETFLDDVKVHTSTSAAPNAAYNIFIGNVNTGGAIPTGGTADTYYYTGKIYSFKIYKDDVLVRDLKPVREGSTFYSSTPAPSDCFYDDISKTYFQKSGGTGTLKAGDRITSVTVDDVPVKFFVNTENELKIPGMPPHAPGAAVIKITTSDGQTRTTSYTYERVVTEIKPAKGTIAGDIARTTIISGTGFTETPYIAFTGDQYVSTQINQVGDVKMEVDFEASSSSTGISAIFGSRFDANNHRFVFFYNDNNSKYRTDYGTGGANGNIELSYTPNFSRHVVVKHKGETTFDGIDQTKSTDGEPLTTYDIYLGSVNNNGTPSYYYKGKIYSSKIWRGDELRQQLLPVKQGSTRYRTDAAPSNCFYNTVSGNYIPPTAGSAFGIGTHQIESISVDGVSVGFTVDDDNNISIQMPSHAVGNVPVVVKTFDGVKHEVPGGYTYEIEVTSIEAVAPGGSSGIVVGNPAIITGTGFQSVPSLTRDYVQDKLQLHYDGIDNAGTGVHDPTATSWVDLSGNGHHGKLKGGLSASGLHWVSGKYLQNSSTAAGNDINIDTDLNLGGLARTWFFTVQDVINDYGALATDANGLNQQGLIFYNYFVAKRTGAENTTRINKDFKISAQTTYAVVLTNTKLQLYINGTLFSTVDNDGYGLIGQTLRLLGGKIEEQRAQTGKMYDFLAYDKALSAAEIAQNYRVEQNRFYGTNIPINTIASITVGGTPVPFTVNSATSISLSMPAHAKGSVPVILTDIYGHSIETSYEYEEAATVDALSPITGNPAGGNAVAIGGVGFKPTLNETHNYVQRGLIVHLDAINNDNTGDAQHNGGALFWKNLATSGTTYDGALYSSPVWSADGLTFDGTDDYVSIPLQATATNPTIEAVGNWTTLSGTRNMIACHEGGGFGLQTEGSLVVSRANINGLSWQNLDYTGVVATNKHAYSFRYDNKTMLGRVDGASYSRTLSNATGILKSDSPNLLLGIQPDAVGGPTGSTYFEGTINAVRYYNRTLSDAEVAYNYAIDRNRFFGKNEPVSVIDSVTVGGISVPFTVTDNTEIIITSMPAHALGSVPVILTDIQGNKYPVANYEYTQPKFADGDNNKKGAATGGNAITLTGSGFKATPRSSADYIQSGLIIHLDAINNAGAGDGNHYTTATTWKNLAPTGTDYDGALSANFAQTATSGWTADSLVFNGSLQNYVGIKRPQFTNPTVEAVGSWASNSSKIQYMLSTQEEGGLSLRTTTANRVSFYPYIRITSGSYRELLYPAAVSAIVQHSYSFRYDGANMLGRADGVSYTQKPDQVATGITVGKEAAPLYLGAEPLNTNLPSGTGTNEAWFSGAINSIRYYDHALTDAEVAWNYAIDNNRFLNTGTPITVNKIVKIAVDGIPVDFTVNTDGEITIPSMPAHAPANVEVTLTDIHGNSYEVAGGYQYLPVELTASQTSGSIIGGNSVVITGGSGFIATPSSTDDYVKNGLLIHYDGINNAGNGNHIPSATIWKNLANTTGTYDGAMSNFNTTTSGWASEGLLFDGSNYVNMGAPPTTDLDPTLELVGKWATSGGASTAAMMASYESGGLSLQRVSGVVESQVHIKGGYVHFKYPTTFASTVTHAYSYRYDGINMLGRVDNRSFRTAQDGAFKHGTANFLLGNEPNGADPGTAWFAGTINSVRYYNRRLSEAEVAWNYAVDNNRFLNIGSPITANKITKVTVDDVSVDFTVDSDGQITITAMPAHPTDGEVAIVLIDVHGNTYEVPGGYKYLPLTVSPEYSNSTGNNSITITGGGFKATPRSSGDYVKPGLLVHFDGINNLGSGDNSHAETMTWKNLANTTNVNNGELNAFGYTTGSGWIANGLAFDGANDYVNLGTPTAVANPTLELVGLWDDDLPGEYQCMLASYQGGGIGLQKYKASSNPEVLQYQAHIDGGYKYLSFSNSIVASNPNAFSFRYNGSMMLGRVNGEAYEKSQTGTLKHSGFNFLLGSEPDGSNLPAGSWFGGTINSVRYYNRVLTNTEVDWNYAVDNNRFLAPGGEQIIANKITKITVDGIETPFTITDEGHISIASMPAHAKGIVPIVLTDIQGVTYTLEHEYTDLSPAYPADGPAKGGNSVTLTGSGFLTTPSSTSDYIQNGLKVHYDGINNINTGDLGHSTTTGTWKNLVTPGTDGALQNFPSAGRWADDGLVFPAGNNSWVKIAILKYPNPTIEVVGKWAAQKSSKIQYMISSQDNGGLALAREKDVEGIAFFQPFIDNTYEKHNYPTLTLTNSHYYSFRYDGTKVIKSVDGTVTFTNKTGTLSYDANTVWALGTNPKNGDSVLGSTEELFKGTINAVRIYDRVLSDKEIAYNLAIDSVRFFNKSAAPMGIFAKILVDDIPVKSFTVDNDGQITIPEMPAHTPGNVPMTLIDFQGRAYQVQGGYTYKMEVESISPDHGLVGGGAAATINGSGFQTIPSRTRDYVQSGLILHYDAINNTGEGDSYHSFAATKWKNLAPPTTGPGMAGVDGTLTGFNYVTTGATANGWTANSLLFGATKDYVVTEKLVGTQFSLEAVGKYGGATARQWMAASTGNGGIAMDKIATSNQARFSAYFNTLGYQYATLSTAIVATVPHSYSMRYDGNILTGTADGGSLPGETVTLTPTNKTFVQSADNERLILGGEPTGSVAGDSQFDGAINSVRYYNRALTQLEVDSNYVVDQNRFFGKTVGYSNIKRIEVDGVSVGSFTVSSDGKITIPIMPPHDIGPASVVVIDNNDNEYEVPGGYEYSKMVVSEISATSGLTDGGNAVRIKGVGFQTTPGTAEEYITRNLKVHYDGINNVGTGDANRNASATEWVNLAATADTHNGLLSNNPLWTSDTRGLVFDGTDDYVTVLGGALKYDFPTVEVVGKWDNTTGLKQNMICNFEGGGLGLRREQAAATVNIRVAILPSAGGDAAYQDLSLSSFTPTQTHAYSFGYDGTYQVGRLDGISYSRLISPEGTLYYDPTAPFLLGANPGANGVPQNSTNFGEDFFKGTINSVRIYDGQLTPAEAAYNYAIDYNRFIGTGAMANTIEKVTVDGEEVEFTVDSEGQITIPAMPPHAAGNVEVIVFDVHGEPYPAPDGYTYVDLAISSNHGPTAGGTPITITGAGFKPAPFSTADYIQNGLQLHFDGINNDGSHSNTATTWKNLAKNEANLLPNYGELHNFSYTPTSGWVSNGLVFDGVTTGNTGDWVGTGNSKGIINPTRTTLEVVGNWGEGFADERDMVCNYAGGGFGLVKNVGGGNGNVSFRTSFAQSSYTDLVLASSAAVGSAMHSYSFRFDPAGGSNNVKGRIDDTSVTATSATGIYPSPTHWALGGNPNTSFDGIDGYWFGGTINSVRLYNRALSDVEAVHNYTVDKNRFLAPGASPITENSIVKITIDGENIASFTVVDDGEITFTLPAHYIGNVPIVLTDIQGRTYTVQGGYTYEPTITEIGTTKGITNGGNSVKITGAGFMATPSSSNAYVKEGLKIHLDGKNNVGKGDSNRDGYAPVWKNLVGTTDYDGELIGFTPSSGGCWTSGGTTALQFDGNDDWVKIGVIDYSNPTMEVVGNWSANTTSYQEYMINDYESGGLGLTKEIDGEVNFKVYVNQDESTKTYKNLTFLPANTATHSYSLAWDGVNQTGRFDGTYYTQPLTGVLTYNATAPIVLGTNPSEEGGNQQETGENHLFKGSINSVRVYNRVLSPAEVAYNYVVDQNRFLGKTLTISSISDVSVDNVAVPFTVDSDGQITITAMPENEEGSVAITLTDIYGNTYPVGDYKYVPLTINPNKGRIDEPKEVVISGAGFQFEPFSTADYIQNGLLFHFDGINNAGNHSTSTTTWKNLAKNEADVLPNYGTLYGGFATNPSAAWGANGLAFNGSSDWVGTGAKGVLIPDYHTLEAVASFIDASPSAEQDVVCNFQGGGFGLIQTITTGTVAFNPHYAISPNVATYHTFAITQPSSLIAKHAYSYRYDGTNMKASTDGGTTVSAARTEAATPSPAPWALGANPAEDGVSTNGAYFKGTINSARLYSRALSAAEVAHNYTVDNNRFLHPEAPITVNNIVHVFVGSADVGFTINNADTITIPAMPTATQAGLDGKAGKVPVKIVDIQGNEYTLDYEYEYRYAEPDSAVWTGAVNTDWNNNANWDSYDKDGALILPATTIAIPYDTTNIRIPGGLANYPVLAETDKKTCRNIYFNFGAEMKNTHWLSYDTAKVELQLNSNQWYMFSAPLDGFYVGDIYATKPNPFQDGYIIEPMLFNTANPQIGGLQDPTLYTANWSGVFNTANVKLSAGQGLAVWVDKIGSLYTDHTPATFVFPKADEEYLYYDIGTQQPTGNTTGALDRSNSHKFIHDGNVLVDGGGDYVPISIGNQVNDTAMVLVGNPFMAHLDVEKFAASNTPLIATEYKLPFGVHQSLDGRVADVVTFKKIGGGTWCNTGTNGLGNADQQEKYRLIAPMQSFIVTPIAKAHDYEFKAYFKDTEVASGSSLDVPLRSTPAAPALLSIVARRGNEKNKVLLLHNEAATADYRPEEDSYKLFASSTETVSLYMRSADGKALDINTIGSFGDIVPLGVRTSEAGAINLDFSGMESFGADVAIYLHDTKLNRVVDLAHESNYTFTKNADEALYLENRLYFSFGNVTGLSDVTTSRIFITQSARDIHVFSGNNSPLESVRIFDLQGRLLAQDEKPGSSYTHTVRTAGIYIVRAVGSAGVEVKKVVVK